ncbi:MAG: hypothetical protein AB7O65_13425, partial [Candidatus Korobacteraceae bacterium]
MNLTPEQRAQAADEIKKFGADLNLSDEQKEKLHTAMAEARAKVQEYVRQNPNASRADIIAKV